MNDFLNDVFDEFFTLGFGKPKNLRFNAQVKDMLPSYWTRSEEDEYLCTVKTLGIEPDAVRVEEATTFFGLTVYGESEVNGFKYNTNIDLPIAESIMNEIKDINYTSKNGLTFITLKMNIAEKKKLKIEKK